MPPEVRDLIVVIVSILAGARNILSTRTHYSGTAKLKTLRGSSKRISVFSMLTAT